MCGLAARLEAIDAQAGVEHGRVGVERRQRERAEHHRIDLGVQCRLVAVRLGLDAQEPAGGHARVVGEHLREFHRLGTQRDGDAACVRDRTADVGIAGRGLDRRRDRQVLHRSSQDELPGDRYREVGCPVVAQAEQRRDRHALAAHAHGQALGASGVPFGHRVADGAAGALLPAVCARPQVHAFGRCGRDCTCQGIDHAWKSKRPIHRGVRVVDARAHVTPDVEPAARVQVVGAKAVQAEQVAAQCHLPQFDAVDCDVQRLAAAARGRRRLVECREQRR